MADTVTDICNLALGRIGISQITTAELTADTEPVPKDCNLHYTQTRDALLRSHLWRFAGARITLASAWEASIAYTTDQYVLNDDVWYKCAVAHTSAAATEPPHANWTTLTDAQVAGEFEWTYKFSLPSDFMRMRSIWEDNTTKKENSIYSYAVEGNYIYWNDSVLKMRYTKKETTVTNFDSLFTEVLVLSLALKLVMPRTQDGKLYTSIKDELYKQVMPRVRTVDKQEQNTVGLDKHVTWNSARRVRRRDDKLGSN